MSGSKHYQLRLVKRIDRDGTITTWSTLGKLYLHDQKTAKNCKSIEDAVARAKEFNQNLGPEVKGMVVVGFRRDARRRVVQRPGKRPYVTTVPRITETTEWLRFVDRNGDVWAVSEDHKITSPIVQ